MTMADEQKAVEEQLAQLQLAEQNLQSFVGQRQQFQMELLEIEHALTEMEKSNGAIFRNIGPLMIAVEKKDLKKDLTNRKEILELRIKNLEKQEAQLREKAKGLQSHIVAKLEASKKESLEYKPSDVHNR